MGWLFLIGGIIGFVFFVDMIYKMAGISYLDTDENECYVPESERHYAESYMYHVMKDYHKSGMY